MEPVQIFDNLKLNDLSQEWVTSIWLAEFANFVDPPDEYLLFIESEDMGCLLKEISTVIRKWIASNRNNDEESDDQSEEVSWQTLTALNINSRNLLAVLGFVINHGQRISADEDSRQACLLATSLYFTLLAVPGSSVYQIFHPNLFQLAIETFKLAEYLIPVLKKANKTLDLSDLYNNDELESEERLQHQEKITLTKGLNSIMFDLINMLKFFYMRHHLRSIDIMVQCLIEVTRLETNINHFQTTRKSNEASLTSLSYNAYIALSKLCDSIHGPTDITITLISKYTLPHLLNYTDLPPKALNVIRETSICFFKNILDSYEEEAKSGMEVLVQHLLANCPERLEARQKQAIIVAKVMNICRGQLFNEVTKTLLLFSHQNKVSYRIFAQEIIGKFLVEMSSCIRNLSEEDLSARLKVKRVLIATIFSRCADDSNMVRGKAMAIVSEIIDPNNNAVIIPIQDIFNTLDEDKNLPSLEQLKRALLVDSDPLPGLNSVYAMFVARAEDERALVRRSALQTLKNMIILAPGILGKVIPIVGRHCRDPSLAVRKFAIQILSQLLQESPENSPLLNEWVQCVVPQVFDIETKVQEKALESMQDLILNSISMCGTKRREDSGNLPWKIIDKLVQEKMRKHLSKACALWRQNEILTDALLNRIQSHINTNNNVGAWVLLAALSQFVQLRNMDIHFINCIEIIRNDNFYANLMLEVLRYSWMSVNRELLQRLHADLYQSLCQFEVSVDSISTCMDILDGVTKFLQPNDERFFRNNMQTLMRSSEAKIEKIFHEKENASDMSLSRIMCTMGYASLLCTTSISSTTLSILQGILLDWDSIPDTLSDTSELRAFAVVLLGQQAMRDREIAQTVTPILGLLMCQATDPRSATESAVRVNAAKALADLCVRFTALVEPFLPDMCVCMKDPNPQVREVIVVIFIQLLLEDFIKVKGPFFFHILTMLSDSDDNIRELTILLIKERLLVKNKTLILQQFLRSIFHYNNCKSRNKFGELKLSEKEKSTLILPGLENQTKRYRIYDFMLEHLDPTGRSKLLVRLTNEIFAGVCDGVLSMEEENPRFVLKDALYILSNDFMQSNFWSSKQNDDDMQEEAPAVSTLPHNNAVNAAVEDFKRHKLEVLLPMLVRLKKKLTILKSSLLVDVSRFFVRVVSDYNKEQLSYLFNEYPTLEKEIDDDVRKYGKKGQLVEEEGIDEDESTSNNRNSSFSKSTSKTSKVVLDCLATTSNVTHLEVTQKTKDTDEERDQTREIDLGKTMSIKKNSKFKCGREPKIMLRRLSTMTYPEGCGSTSPSNSSNSSRRLIRSSRSRSSSISSVSKLSLSSPEPGPSSSTPISFEDDSLQFVPNYSPIKR